MMNEWYKVWKLPYFTLTIFFFCRCDDNGTVVIEPIPTDLRLHRHYIIIYVNWVWTITTVILPLIFLIFLSIRIYQGLIKVRKNLNRHKRLVEKAEVATAAISPHPQQGLQGQGSKRVSVKINVADVDEEPEGNDHGDVTHHCVKNSGFFFHLINISWN